MRPLSYTQISRYRTCPLWYKLQYIDRLKPKERFYFSFGDVIHKCAEFFYKVPAPPPPSLERLRQFYEANWTSAGYETPEQEQQYKEYGYQLLEEFWQKQYPGFRMPIAVEYFFRVRVAGDVILSGRIDRVDKEGDGLSIVDYKTNQNPFTAEQLEEDLQLTFYQLGVEATWKMPVKKLTLYHLRTNIPFTCEGRSPERLEEARRIILETAEGIQSQSFPAVENALCDYCDFPEHCPYRKHLYSQSEEVSPEMRMILHGREASEVVKEYAALQEQKRGIEARIEELEQMISRYCEAQGLKRLYGGAYTVSHPDLTLKKFRIRDQESSDEGYDTGTDQ